MTRRHYAVALLVSGTLACASWRPIADPARFIAESRPAEIHVVHRNRSRIPMVAPHISGDTLLGTWHGSTRPVAVPLGQVASVSARQHDKTKTTLLIVGLAGFTAGLTYALTLSGNGEPQYCDYTSWPPRACP